MQPQTFIFFGKSGSGKGTQAHLLMEYIEKNNGSKVMYVETGQGFRDFVKKDNYTSDLTRKVLKEGGLLPVFMPIWLWTDRFVNEFDGTQDLILDGLCRRPQEAPVLDSALKFYGREKPVIVYINVSDKWAFERLKDRGRNDDTDEYIKSRLEWFEWNVVPAMAYFHEHPDYYFWDINGEQTIEEVHADIIKRLK